MEHCDEAQKDFDVAEFPLDPDHRIDASVSGLTDFGRQWSGTKKILYDPTVSPPHNSL